MTGPANLPPNFDPERFPIIAEHYFGWRRLGDVTTNIVRRVAAMQESNDDRDEVAA